MANVKLYTTAWCPFCHAAKALLEKKAVPYEEIPISKSSEDWRELTAETGMYTVPQIFIGDRFIGGFDDMRALDRKGELDPLLFDSV